MKTIPRLFICPSFLIAFASVSLCLAADSPWTGTWKSKPVKSSQIGSTFTITLNSDGTYRYSNGSIVEFDFACDGRPHTVLDGRSLTCTGDAAKGFDFSMMAKGNVVQKSHRTLSADGNTYTIDTTTMLPDGTTANRVATYERIGTGTGLVGRWKGITEESSQPFVWVVAVSHGIWHEEHPDEKGKIDANLDGTDSPWIGPTYPEGFVASFKQDGPNKVHVVTKIRDKVLEEEILLLSGDGKTITDEIWFPERKDEKRTTVYQKQ